MTPSEVQKFLEGHTRNEWYTSAIMDVYVHKGFHYCQKLDDVIPTFDIASIHVHQPGKKVFTHWLPMVREHLIRLGLKALYIESVQNDRLVESLRDQGWYELGGRCFFDIFWKYS